MEEEVVVIEVAVAVEPAVGTGIVAEHHPQQDLDGPAK